MKVVLRNCDIAWVTDDVDDLRITWVEVLVALDHTRPRHGVHFPLRKCFGVGNELVDVTKIGLDFRMQKIGDQKPSPCVTGLRVRDDEDIVRIDQQIASRMMQAKHAPESCFDMPQHCATLYLS